MNCIEFRRQTGSAPQTHTEEAEAHRQACSTCARFADDALAMDRVLEQALQVAVPNTLSDPDALFELVQSGGEQTSERTRYTQRTQRAWYALAASVLVGVGLVTGLWLGQSQDNLSNDLIAHILHEPGSLSPDRPSVELSRVSNVLQRGRVLLKGDIGDVRYAGLCPFRGMSVPHLVVQGEKGPITVMLLPDENVSERTPFDEEGFKGVIIPTGRGSIAIIGNPDELLEPVQEQFSRSVEFSI